MLKLGSDTNILTYFPDSEEDGVNIKWAHGVNTLDKLERALYSSKTVIPMLIHIAGCNAIFSTFNYITASIAPIHAFLSILFYPDHM